MLTQENKTIKKVFIPFGKSYVCYLKAKKVCINNEVKYLCFLRTFVQNKINLETCIFLSCLENLGKISRFLLLPTTLFLSSSFA